jgi:2-desacetyl-2-hydroxyethyl bacteriochlorophyllide A dehydrogenase
MRAVTLLEPGQAMVLDAPRPEPSGKVLVRIQTVGLCGTDTSIVAGKIPAPYPVILGHEAVGVVEVADTDGLVSPGRRVLIDPGIACEACDLCRRGYPNLCRNGGLLGRDFDGVFADYAAVAGHQLLDVPDHVSDDAAGLLQVLGTCVHTVAKAPVFPGDVAVVIGLGVGGQLISQLLALQGATVIGVTRSKWKRDLAVEHGAALAVDPGDAAAAVADLTAGRGAEVVVEAVGVESTFAQAIELAGAAGSVVLFGTATSGGSGLPYYQLYFKELTIHNPRAATKADYQRSIDLVTSGAIHAAPLVTNRFPLDDALKVLMTT